ncbi:hypothetical protein EXS70_03965 [Candidatus Peribacteria bacterium]|nr:hypothetical protein [Candidatus Peribacteria bacterium]
MFRPSVLLRAALTAILLAVPASVLAVDMYPPILCTGLFGCGRPPEDVLMQSTLPTAAWVMVQLAAAGAVIAIVIGGVQMTLSYGDEAKVGNARKAILFALGGLGLVLAAAPIVSFVISENYGMGGGDFLFGPGGVMASVIRIILTLFNVAFVIVIILAGLRMIMAMGASDEFKKGGDMIKWAIVGAVVVNLARALVQAFLALNL